MKITGKEFADFIRKSEQNRIVRGILKLDTPDMADIICVIVGEDKPVVVWNAPAGKNESEGKTESGTFAKMETVPAVQDGPEELPQGEKPAAAEDINQESFGDGSDNLYCFFQEAYPWDKRQR